MKHQTQPEIWRCMYWCTREVAQETPWAICNPVSVRRFGPRTANKLTNRARVASYLDDVTIPSNLANLSTRIRTLCGIRCVSQQSQLFRPLPLMLSVLALEGELEIMILQCINGVGGIMLTFIDKDPETGAGFTIG